VGDLAELKEKDYGSGQQPASKRELFRPPAPEVSLSLLLRTAASQQAEALQASCSRGKPLLATQDSSKPASRSSSGLLLQR
jgi:hypothetical protein